jgi:hypothetical protein
MRGLLSLAMVWTLVAALGCGDDSSEADAGPAPAFPENFLDTYTEVRNCRSSGDHDLNVIKVLADPAALGPYQNRDEPFPVGSVIIKQEHEFGDTDCSERIVGWTVMQRLPAGSDPDLLGWTWQRVDSERRVVEQDTPRCWGCHTGCGFPPDGYEGTCTVP